MKIEWYPGHINKARKEIEKNLVNIDLVMEVVDARCPISCLSPYIKSLTTNKKHLIIVNKIDYLDNQDISIAKKQLISYGIPFVLLDSRKNNISNYINPLIKSLLDEKIEKYKNKGIQNHIFKSLVVGMPNVGKSTFINSFVRKKVANTGDKAGITKSLQWVTLSKNLILLDTPGITVPKFESEKVGTNLYLIGCLNDDIGDMEEASNDLFKFIYKKDNVDFEINEYAKKSGCLKKGGEVDLDRVSKKIIFDFRSGKLGSIYLDK